MLKRIIYLGLIVSLCSQLVPLSHPLYAQGLTGLDDRTLYFKDYHGKVILVNFWATWCAPCVAEMPTFEELKQAIDDDDFVIVAVNMAENPQKISDFLNRLPTSLSYHLVYDRQGELFKIMNIKGLPTTLILDRQGRLAANFLGEKNWMQADMQSSIRKLLAH